MAPTEVQAAALRVEPAAHHWLCRVRVGPFRAVAEVAWPPTTAAMAGSVAAAAAAVARRAAPAALVEAGVAAMFWLTTAASAAVSAAPTEVLVGAAPGWVGPSLMTLASLP